MPYKEKDKWRGCVVQQGKRHTALMSTRREAVKWEAAKRKEFAQGPKPSSGIDLLNLCAKYLTYASRYVKKTLAEKESLCRRILKLWGASTMIEEITSAMVLDFLMTQAQKRSNNASNRDRKNLMVMFEFARKYYDLEKNPVSMTDNLSHDRKTQYTPSPDDIRKVLEIASPEDRVFLNCYLHTGARRSEIFHWLWYEDINFDKKEVRLGTRKTKDQSMEYEWLPMNADLYENLLWWFNNRSVKDSPYVFVNDKDGNRYQGQPYTTRRKFLSGLCKRAGVKGFGFHALRRFVASSLADTHGVSAKTIQRILRHKNVTTTEKYIQNVNQDLRSTMALLSGGANRL